MSHAAQQLASFKQSKKPSVKMVPVHVEKDEVRYFNFLQGGQFIDPQTHLREYSRLYTVLQEPEMYELFVKMANFVKEHDRMPRNVAKMSKVADKNIPPFEYIPSDENPKVEAIENFGTHNDKVLVMFPIQFVDLLDRIQGKENDDPTLHLQQFGFFKNVVRAVATVAGYYFGGPAGAGLANAGARMATGQKFGEAAVGGLKTGALAYGASLIPGVSSAASALGSASGLSGIFGSGAGAAAAGAHSVGAAGAGAASAAGAAAAPAAASGLSQYLTPKYLVPATAIGAGLLLGSRGQKKEEKQDQEDYDKARGRVSNVLESGGYNQELKNAGLKRHSKLNRSFYEGPVGYKKGGHLAVKGEPIVGRGRGQEDLIPRNNIKEGGWIWDATTTAHLGDGATDAGHKHIEDFEKSIKKRLLKAHGGTIIAQDKATPPRKVPCALSNGERHTPRVLVSALGEGDNKRGADILRKMTEEIRLHKVSNGKKLPPAAHDLMTYYKKVI